MVTYWQTDFRRRQRQCFRLVDAIPGQAAGGAPYGAAKSYDMSTQRCVVTQMTARRCQCSCEMSFPALLIAGHLRGVHPKSEGAAVRTIRPRIGPGSSPLGSAD